MTVYDTVNGVTLFTGSSDPDPGDPRYLIEVNGVAPGAWPYATQTDLGVSVLVHQNALVQLDAAANDDHPQDGSRRFMGSITAQASDGIDPSNVQTYDIYLTAYATPPAPSGLSTDGLVMDWNPDAGLATSGSNITGWTEQANNVAATLVGTPTVGTGSTGTQTNSIVIGLGAGFNFFDLSHLPVSNSARTMQLAVKFTATGVPFWGGFGYGDPNLDGSFSIILDQGGQLIFDFKDHEIPTGLYPIGETIIVTATYDGTTFEGWVGNIKVASEAVTLVTGSAQGNIGRSFSGATTTCEIFRARILAGKLSDATILSDVAELNALCVGSTALADHSAGTASAINSAGFTYSGNAVSQTGIIAQTIRTSATPPSKPDLLAGTGALDFGLIALSGESPGTAFSFNTDLATDDQDYYVSTVEYNLVGGESNVITSSAIHTSAATVSPTQVLANGVPITSISVDENFPVGGTLAQLTADQPATFTETSDPSNRFAINSGGLWTTTGALLAANSPYDYGIEADGGTTPLPWALSISVSQAVASSYDADVVVSTMEQAKTQAQTWIANPSGTVPAGKGANDTRVVRYTDPVSGDVSISGLNASAIAGGIVIRGTGPYTWGSTFPFHPTCQSHINGTVTMSGNNNVQLAMTSCTKVDMTGNANGSSCYKVGMIRNWSSTLSGISIGGGAAGQGVQLTNSPGCFIDDCYISGHDALTVRFLGGNHNFALRNCFAGYTSGDSFKFNGNASDNDVRITGNWMTRELATIAFADGSGAHTDFLQAQQGHNTPNLLIEKNMVWEGRSLTRPARQAIWKSGGGDGSGTTIRDNYFGLSAGNGISFSGTSLVELNAVLYAEIGAHGSVQGNTPEANNEAGYQAPRILSGLTNRYNIGVRTNNGSPNTAGTGGVSFAVGNFFTNPAPANVSGYAGYYKGFPTHYTYLDALEPLNSGVATHWSFGGQKIGCHDLLQDIFVRGLTPMHRGWPCASHASREYAPIGSAAHSAISSTFTGTIDANCNNA